jgi:hypothetical protein
MTNEQINAAIAKVLKYKQWYPNFATDLNAMHEAEKVLDSDELFRGYYLALYDITKSTRWPINATARQRAEAFLRTLGKWEDGE